MVCLIDIIDINASALDAPAADWLGLHQTTGDAQHSAVHSSGAQLQVIKSTHLGDDIIMVTGFKPNWVPVLLQKCF